MTRAKGRRAMTTPVPNADDFEDGVKQEVIDQRIQAAEAANNAGNPDADSSVDTEFFNIFDGTKGRSNGMYLDIAERIAAEKVRAIAEGREANLSEPGKLPAATGTPLVPAARQVDNSLYSNPSIAFTGEKDVDPVVELPVDLGVTAADVDLGYAAQVARERKAQDEALSSESVSLSDPENNAGPEFTERTLEESQNADYNTNDTTI